MATTLVLVGYFLGWIPIQCPFLKYFDVHCLTCGTTRACHAVFSGDVLKALSYNPLTFLWLTAGLLSYLDFGAISLLDKRPHLFRRFTRFIERRKGLQVLFVLACIANLCYVNGLLTSSPPLDELDSMESRFRQAPDNLDCGEEIVVAL